MAGTNLRASSGGRPAHRQIAPSGGARLGLKDSALSGSGLGLNALPQPRAEQRYPGSSLRLAVVINERALLPEVRHLWHL